MKDVGTSTRTSTVRTLAFSVCAVSLTLIAPLQSQSLVGTVKDGTNGLPIADASVVLMDDDGRIQRGTLTEPDGTYMLSVPDDGSYTLRVGAAGFATQDTPPFSVEGTDEARIDILLQSEDETTTVPLGFTQRMARGEGLFITREQIEERSGNLFTDIFQFTPIVRVAPLPAS